MRGELRLYTAFSWRYSGQKYTCGTAQTKAVEVKTLAHSVVSVVLFVKT